MNGLDLRPLSIGDILDRTFSLYRRNFLLFVGIAGIPQLLVLVFSLGQTLLSWNTTDILTGTRNVGIGVLVLIVYLVVAVVAYLYSQGGTMLAISELYLGRTTTIAESLRNISSDLGYLLGVTILSGLAVMGAMILLIVPGIYVACRLLVCVPAALIEKRSPREALSRSFGLTKGFAGRAFVILVLSVVMTYAAQFLLAVPATIAMAARVGGPGMARYWLALTQVGSSLASILVTPILLIATAVFYFDLRVRKEGFDLQIMMDPDAAQRVPRSSDIPSILEFRRTTMRRLISCWVLLTIACGILPVFGQHTGQHTGQQPGAFRASYTPASLAKELRHVKRTLEDSGDAQTLAALPPAWQVETPERSFSISSEPLRLLLANPADREEGTAWLDHLADYLEGAGTASAGSRPQERIELTRILARPEFAGNAPPTRWELFQERIITWIRDMVERIFSFAKQHPSGSKILFWVVITGAIAILGSWLLRLWTHANQTLSLTAPGQGRKARTWEEWLQASRAAADRGDPREAIRMAYWAGILRLQEVRALPVQASQTPRENLRFLVEPRPGAAPASPALQESLSGLTSGLERFWYARRLAGPEDVRESLRHLEALGCKVD